MPELGLPQARNGCLLCSEKLLERTTGSFCCCLCNRRPSCLFWVGVAWPRTGAGACSRGLRSVAGIRLIDGDEWGREVEGPFISGFGVIHIDVNVLKLTVHVLQPKNKSLPQGPS